jgi:nitrogen fixation protein NifU and related proteins
MSERASAIYQSVILNHNRSPKGYGLVPLATHKADGFNPICGDKVTVTAIIVNEKFVNLGFTAQSCALCRASASVMVDTLANATLCMAEEFVSQFENMLRGKAAAVTGDAAAFEAIRDYPARAKCVLLPWRTLTEALQKVSTGSSGPLGLRSVSTELGE